MMQSWKAGSKGTQVVKTFIDEKEEIYSVLIDEQSQSIFIGTYLGTLHQVDLRSHKKIKKYSGLGIGKIEWLSAFHNLLFMGGNNYRFSLINIKEKRVLTLEPVKTPIRILNSSHFVIINRNNNPMVVLAVSGGESLLYN